MDYTGVTYQNEEISIHAEKEVRVANGMEIIPLNEDKQHAYIGESYLMQVQVKVYDANGSESKLRICDNVNKKTDLSEFSIRGNLNGTAQLSSDKRIGIIIRLIILRIMEVKKLLRLHCKEFRV